MDAEVVLGLVVFAFAVGVWLGNYVTNIANAEANASIEEVTKLVPH